MITIKLDKKDIQFNCCRQSILTSHVDVSAKFLDMEFTDYLLMDGELSDIKLSNDEFVKKLNKSDIIKKFSEDSIEYFKNEIEKQLSEIINHFGIDVFYNIVDQVMVNIVHNK